MSKVNKAIETTISEVKKYATQPYGARLYSWESVIDLLQNLAIELGDEDGESTGNLNDEQIESLASYIARKVEDSIQSMDESDIVDAYAVSMTIYRGDVSIDSIDVNKDDIVQAATEDIESSIHEWLKNNS